MARDVLVLNGRLLLLRPAVLVDQAVEDVRPVDDGRDPRRAAHVLVQVERCRLAPAAAQQLGVASPLEAAGLDALPGVPGYQQPRALARALAACPEQLEQHPELGQGQVLRLVDDETVERHPRRQALAGEQARGGRGGRQLGEYLHAGALGHLLPQPQKRLRRSRADPLLVAPLPAVRIRSQRRQLRAVVAVGLAVDASAEQPPAHFGVHGGLVAFPRVAFVADGLLDRKAEFPPAFGRRYPAHVRAGDLAGQRPEVRRADPARRRREGRQPFLGAAFQPRRPGDVEDVLARARFDGPPQRRRLAASRASAQHPHRAPVGLERRLLPVLRPSCDVLVHVRRLLDRQVVSPPAATERRMVVVVPHGAHDYRSRLGAATVRRPAAPGYPPPQVVLAAACAAQRRAPPPAVRPRAPLDDRGASVGGQLLEDQPEPPVQVRPPPQRVRHARVQPDRLRQRARLVGLLRRDVRPEAVGLVGGSRPGPACAAGPASVGHYSSSSSCITLLASTHASVSRALRFSGIRSSSRALSIRSYVLCRRRRAYSPRKCARALLSQTSLTV